MRANDVHHYDSCFPCYTELHYPTDTPKILTPRIIIIFHSGSTYHLGNYDECLGIGKNADDLETPIRGQYCLGDIKIRVPEASELADGILSPMWRKFRKLEQRYDDKIDELHWGICVPDACSSRDVEDFIATIFANTLARTNFDVRAVIRERSCYKDEPVRVDNYAVIYL